MTSAGKEQPRVLELPTKPDALDIADASDKLDIARASDELDILDGVCFIVSWT